MEVKSWPYGVNRIILSETSPVVGENAVAADKAENGVEMTRLLNSGAPDKWNVVMIFHHSTEDEFYKKYNKTEYEVFMDWFKYVTCMGTKPFYFKKISSLGEDNTPAVYRFTANGHPKSVSNGTYQKVTMTWTEVITTAITVQDKKLDSDHITVLDGYIDFEFNQIPEEDPKKTDFECHCYKENSGEYITDHINQKYVIDGFEYDGNRCVYLYFTPPSEKGIYTFYVSYKDGTPVSDTFEVV